MNSSLLDKNRTQDKVKCQIQQWKKLTYMNHNKKGKSQVTRLYFLLIFLKEILLEHFQSLFGKSNRDFFLENEGKIYYMKEDM